MVAQLAVEAALAVLRSEVNFRAERSSARYRHVGVMAPLPASDPLLIVRDHLVRHAELSTAAKQPLLRRGERTIFDLMLELIDQLTQHLDSASPRAVQRPVGFSGTCSLYTGDEGLHHAPGHKLPARG